MNQREVIFMVKYIRELCRKGTVIGQFWASAEDIKVAPEFALYCREGRLTKQGVVRWNKTLTADRGLCVCPTTAVSPCG